MMVDVPTALMPRPLAASVGDLLAGVERREPFLPPETRSTVRFERVWIDGQRLVVKYLHPDDDFALRGVGATASYALRAFAAGLFDVAGDLIDHAVVAAAPGAGRDGTGAAFLMRDVSADLVPPGDDPLPEAQHLAFLDHLAGLCARTWGWRDTIGLLPYPDRWRFFGAAAIAGERRLGWPERVPRVAAEGWARFADRAPAGVAAAVEALRHDVGPLAGALAGTPSCFLHGDWKAANLGTAPDGRTVLIDWVYVGEGPPCHELAWYLALNRARLPVGHTKERATEDFRAALEGHGVDTGGWWDTQLALCLLGAVVEFGWEKALGDDAELAWWCDRAAVGLDLL